MNNYFQANELWGTFDSEQNTAASKMDGIKDCIDMEMKKYLALPRIGRQEDPIKWWFNIGKIQFPMLFYGAQKYQCMTATSVPSERVFSTAGNIITKKRARLGTQLVNELVTLSHNLD